MKNFYKKLIAGIAIVGVLALAFAIQPNNVSAASVSFLAVGGGGGGGQAINNTASRGGGGGAGGYVTGGVSILSGVAYTITVGTGGAGGTGVNQNNGSNGGNSSFASFAIAVGGGGGGAGGVGSGTFQNGLVGNAGGSGGGGGGGSCLSVALGGNGAPPQGNNGGRYGPTPSCAQGSGGGGGGAGGVGQNDTTSGSTRASGGVGTSNSIGGSSITYATGGRSGGTTGAQTAGTTNTGNGGDGGTGVQDGVAGGSGIVIISAPIGTITSATGGTHTTSGGNDIWTFTSSDTWTPTFSGTGTGAVLPGTGANNNSYTGSCASNSWANPGNITAIDGAVARLASCDGATSNYLEASNFGFSLPSNAIIAGIVLTINRANTGTNADGGCFDDRVRLVNAAGTVLTPDKRNSAIWPTVFTSVTYGDSNDLWSSTWAASDINNSNFGAVFSATQSDPDGGNNDVCDVDYMTMAVYYTIPAATSAVLLVQYGHATIQGGNITVRQ